MPMSRISVLNGKSPDYIRGLGDSLQPAASLLGARP